MKVKTIEYKSHDIELHIEPTSCHFWANSIAGATSMCASGSDAISTAETILDDMLRTKPKTLKEVMKYLEDYVVRTEFGSPPDIDEAALGRLLALLKVNP